MLNTMASVAAILDKYGLSDRFDAKKVLLKMGGRRPGKRCKNGWIAAEKQCSDHKTADGKLTAAGKSSASELADKVRQRKGMTSKQSIAQGKLSGAKDKDNSEYWKFSRSQSQSLGTGAMAKAGADLAKVETQSGKARIWNKPFNEQSMRIFGYTGQDVHRKQVEKAIRRGDVIPKDVLNQYPEFAKLTGDKPEPARKKNATSAKAIVKEMAGYETDILKKQLVGLDDRIEAAQKSGTARKTAATKARNKAITPAQLNSGDRKQAVAYNNQGAARAMSEGRSGDASAWEKQAKSARIADVRSSKRQKSTSQGEMFGIEEATDLPLSRKRKDSLSRQRRFDRAIAGGKTTPKSTRKKHNCTSKSRQCGSVCIPIANKCRDGAVGGAQDRLRKLKKSGSDDLQVQRAKNSIKERTVGKRAEIDGKRIASLRNRIKNAAAAGVGKSEGLAELDPHSIEVDPKRFQYKIIGEHTSTGSVGSLSGVRKYDPNLAGILQVWKDPANGKTYVVNGHNRLDLGKKLGAESVAVRYLKAPDAKTARSIGALTNIAEGRGDALDAAKFFRDTGISKEDLSAKGIPMREKIATDGLALSKLDDSLFRKTIDGEIPMARAAIIGGSGLQPAQQRDLMTLVDKEGKKKTLTDGAISEMVDIAKSSQTHQESTMSLFGEESVTKSNMIEKAKLQAAIKQRLSREKNLFGTVSRGRAATELARGGNTIDREKSGDLSTQASQSLKTFDQMKNLSGPMSDAINHAASRMAAGESQKSVEKDLYAKITSIDVFGKSKKLAA